MTASVGWAGLVAMEHTTDVAMAARSIDATSPRRVPSDAGTTPPSRARSGTARAAIASGNACTCMSTIQGASAESIVPLSIADPVPARPARRTAAPGHQDRRSRCGPETSEKTSLSPRSPPGIMEGH